MDHLEFLDKVLLDFSMCYEDSPDGDPIERFRQQFEKIEQDEEFLESEREDANLSLMTALLIDGEMADQVEKHRQQVNQLRAARARVRHAFSIPLFGADQISESRRAEILGSLEFLAESSDAYFRIDAHFLNGSVLHIGCIVEAEDYYAAYALACEKVARVIDGIEKEADGRDPERREKLQEWSHLRKQRSEVMQEYHAILMGEHAPFRGEFIPADELPEGYFRAQTSLIDHDRLDSDFWTSLKIPDDAGQPCNIHYNDVAEGGPFVHVFGYMQAEEQDTANFLLSARVEAFLNRLDAEEQVAA